MATRGTKVERGIRKGLVDPSTRTTGVYKLTTKGLRRKNTKTALRDVGRSVATGLAGAVMGGAMSKKQGWNRGAATGVGGALGAAAGAGWTAGKKRK